jgi:hypothetical protein
VYTMGYNSNGRLGFAGGSDIETASSLKKMTQKPAIVEFFGENDIKIVQVLCGGTFTLFRSGKMIVQTMDRITSNQMQRIVYLLIHGCIHASLHLCSMSALCAKMAVPCIHADGTFMEKSVKELNTKFFLSLMNQSMQLVKSRENTI